MQIKGRMIYCTIAAAATTLHRCTAARGPPWLRRPTKTDTSEQHKTTEHIPVYSYRIIIPTANVGLL